MMQEIQMAVEIGLLYSVLALGLSLTFRTLNFADLTCDGSFVTGGAVSAVLIQMGGGPWLGLVGAAAAGGLAGALTALLSIKGKIEDLLSGILVAFMLYSINLHLMGSSPNLSLVPHTTVLQCGPALVVGGVIVLLLIGGLATLLSSDFGLGLRAVGLNRRLAAAMGVQPDRKILFGLALSNALVGLSGALFTQYQGFCDVSQGAGTLIMGLASIILGEKIPLPVFRSKNVNLCLWGQMLRMLGLIVAGSIAYRLFLAVALNSDFLGLKTQDLNLITGLLIVTVMWRKKCWK